MTKADRETLENLLERLQDELEYVAESTGTEPDISLYDAVSTLLSELAERDDYT